MTDDEDVPISQAIRAMVESETRNVDWVICPVLPDPRRRTIHVVEGLYDGDDPDDGQPTAVNAA